MSTHVLEYCPIYDHPLPGLVGGSPPLVPKSGRLWFPPPGHVIPSSGRSSALGAGHCPAPFTPAALPLLLPRWGAGVSPIDAATIAVLNTIGADNGGDWIIPVAVYSATFAGGYSVDTDYRVNLGSGEIYAGSTGFEVPALAAYGLVAHVTAGATGDIEQVNSNLYATPGPHDYDIGMSVSFDRAYVTDGIGPYSGVTPGWRNSSLAHTNIYYAHRGAAPTDYTIANPGWLPPAAVGGFFAASFFAGTYPNFGEALVGSVSASLSLTLTYYNIGGHPGETGWPSGAGGFLNPPSSGAASDRGGCC